MAGTRIGGLKTYKKNIKNDPEFYRKIGAIGGRKGHIKGFAVNPELASKAGRKGGRARKHKQEE